MRSLVALFLATVLSITASAGTPQVIDFEKIQPKAFGDAPFQLHATSNSNFPIRFQVLSGPVTTNGNTVTISAPGTATIRAIQDANGIYDAGTADQTFEIAKKAQTIAFAALPDRTVGFTPTVLSAVATSGLPVLITVVSGPATLFNGSLYVYGVGTVTIRASQSGDATFSAAPDVERSFKVGGGNTIFGGSDTDGDGFSDLIELAIGTSPFNPLETPLNGAPAVTPAPLTGVKLSIRLNFAMSGKDSIQLQCVLFPAPADASGTLLATVGGVVRTVVLDSKGHGKSGKDAAKLTLSKKSTGAKLSFKMQGDFAQTLSEAGLANATLRTTVSLPVGVLVGTNLYGSEQGVDYTAKSGKKGAAKVAR